jgi:rfaE bifunctional protein nucleotidyltransferase chain/domain
MNASPTRVNYLELIQAKLHNYASIQEHIVNLRKEAGHIIVFTNGCFDLLHRGHYTYLAQAASLGSSLIVGVNSDASVQRLKGHDRPIHPEADRCLALAALQCVGAVVSFEEDTPLHLIKTVQPDILVKGGDYKLDTIVGADEVLKLGGQVLVLPFKEGYSSTKLINRLRS